MDCYEIFHASSLFVIPVWLEGSGFLFPVSIAFIPDLDILRLIMIVILVYPFTKR